MTNEDRAEIIMDTTGIAMKFLAGSMSAAGDNSVLVEQALKTLLTMASFNGMFKDKALGDIYRNRDIAPLEKTVRIAQAFLGSMVADPTFHANVGEWFDTEFAKIFNKFIRFENMAIPMPDQEGSP